MRVFSTIQLPRLMLVLAGVFMCYRLVDLTLFLTASQPPLAPAAALRAKPEKPLEKVNLAALQALPLFGDAQGRPRTALQKAPAAVEIEAEKTRLNLNLTGIVAATDEEEGAAFLLVDKKQSRYRVGERLPVGARVTLAHIMKDRIIIDNNGQLESVWLDSGNAKLGNKRLPGEAGGTREQSGSGPTAGEGNEISALRDRFYQNPSSLTEVLQLSPVDEQGQLIGYRLSPGEDGVQFKQLGFEADDILTAVNGLSLRERANLPSLYTMMREAGEVSLSIRRDGEEMQLRVPLH